MILLIIFLLIVTGFLYVNEAPRPLSSIRWVCNILLIVASVFLFILVYKTVHIN